MKPYYEHAGITIYHGDCREVMPALKADAIITDPPYGVGVADWDVADPAWLGMAADVLPNDAHLFSFWSVSRLREFPDIPGMKYERVLVWSKPMTLSSQRSGATWHWEPIFWWVKGKPRLSECVSDVIEVNPPLFRTHPENVNHPTQKPEAIMTRLVELSGAATVLDPFCGSGTTLRAAKDLGRRAIGIEIEERYCEIAAKRLSQEVLDLTARAGSGEFSI